MDLAPPPHSLSSLQHFLSWEELGPAPHSLPAAQDLEGVVPNWAGASAVTWDADFEKRRLVHVMQPLQSSWWGFLPLIPKYSPFSTAEAQGSGSFLVRLTYPEPVFGGLPLTFPSLALCCDFGGPDAGSMVEMLRAHPDFPPEVPCHPRSVLGHAAMLQHKVLIPENPDASPGEERGSSAGGARAEGGT